MTHAQSAIRNADIVKDARKLKYIKGKTTEQLQIIADKYGISKTLVCSVLRNHTNLTGSIFGFRPSSQKGYVGPVRISNQPRHRKGVCLLCKRATGQTVRMYEEGAHCFACNDTGYYIDAIMDKQTKGKGKK